MINFFKILFLLPTTLLFSQIENLSDIQRDLNKKKENFTIYHNGIAKQAQAQYLDLNIKKDQSQLRLKKSNDSILGLIKDQEVILAANKIQFDNFNRLQNLLLNQSASILLSSKSSKKFIKITGVDYPTKMIYKDNKSLETYYLISIDKDRLVKIDTFYQDKKVASLYAQSAEENRLAFINEQKLIDLTNASLAIEKNKSINNLKAELKMLDYNQRKIIESIELKLKSLEPAAISKARLSDSIKLNEHINYYFKIYPAELAEYSKSLEIEKQKDLKFQEEYNSQLTIWENQEKYKTQNIEAEADKCFDWIKDQLNDPYSARFEKYGVITSFTDLNKKYPCIKVYNITIRAKNGWGAYIPGKYFVAMKDGIPVAGAENGDENRFVKETNLMLNIMLENIECSNTSISEPVKPIPAEQRLSAPKLKLYDFSFYSLN